MVRSMKATTSLGLTIIVGALLLYAAPAFAEFEGSKSGGSGEVTDATLEAGGGTVTCQAFEEGSSKAKWVIKNGTTEAEKGADLLVKVEKWGKCTAESSGIKSEANFSECEMELVQTSTSGKVLVNLPKSCTIKASLCEIFIEPGKELKMALAADSGSENKNLLDLPEVSGVTTVTKGLCPGIKSGKEGKLLGMAEMKLVHYAMPVFEVAVLRQLYNGLNTTGVLKILNTTNAQQTVAEVSEIERPTGRWLKPTFLERTGCARAYAAMTECSMNIEFANAGAGGLAEIAEITGGALVGHSMGGT